MAAAESAGDGPGRIARAAAVLRSAAGLGHRHRAFVLRLAVLIFVPLGLLGTLDETLWDAESAESGLILIPLIISAFALAATSILGSLLFAGALAAAIAHPREGEEPSIRRIASEAPWRTLVAIDLLFVAGLALGLVALVVPGLIWFGRYVLAATVADVERRGVRDSFRRAAELSGGHRLEITVLLTGAVLAGEAIQAALVAGAGELFGEGFLVDWLTNSVAQIVSNPIFGLIAVALVLTLKEQHREPRRPLGKEAGSAA